MTQKYVPVFVLLVLILCPFTVYADVSVSLDIGRDEATPLDSIRMVVSVSGSRKSVEPDIKGLEDFHVTKGGTSSRVEIVNGAMNSGVDYTYYIQAKKTGEFTIGPAEVTIKGKKYAGNTVRLTIRESDSASGEDRGKIFLTTQLSSDTAYLEEQIIYSLKLYLRAKVSDISLSLPEDENIVLKQIGKPREYQTVYNGNPYRVLEVQYSLIASAEGEYMLGPASMRMNVHDTQRRGSRGFFDDEFFSFSSGRPIRVAGGPVTLKVLPLPEEGRPRNFSGLVGSFELTSTLEPSSLKSGESSTLTVRLSGSGNVNRMPDLELPELEDVKVYADQPALEVENSSKGMTGSKIMKWALVFEKPGEYRLPPLTVSFFDTGSNQYREITSAPYSISVQPGEEKEEKIAVAAPQNTTRENVAKQEVEELGRDILPVHTSLHDFTKKDRFYPGKPLFLVVLLFPAGVYLAAFVGVKLRNKSDKAAAAGRTRKAAAVCIKRCRRERLSSNDAVAAVRDFFHDRLGSISSALTSAEAADMLEERGASESTVAAMKKLIRSLESNIYTGKGDEPFAGVDEIIVLVKAIDKEIR